MKVGFTCGAWDLLHAGHISFLAEAKSQCSHLVVGLHTNPNLDRREKNIPVQSTYERYVQLCGCKYIDSIIPYDTELDLLNILLTNKFDIRFLGTDYENKPFTGDHLPIDVLFIERYHSYSTSELRDRIVDYAKFSRP